MRRSTIVHRDVFDGMFYVVYDSHGVRRGAFDDETDAQAFLAIVEAA